MMKQQDEAGSSVSNHYLSEQSIISRPSDIIIPSTAQHSTAQHSRELQGVQSRPGPEVSEGCHNGAPWPGAQPSAGASGRSPGGCSHRGRGCCGAPHPSDPGGTRAPRPVWRGSCPPASATPETPNQRRPRPWKINYQNCLLGHSG